MQPLFYRPNEFDDWGQIRNADGSMFASVRRPLSEEEAAEHRRNKTDPFEDLARTLMAGVAAQRQESTITPSLDTMIEAAWGIVRWKGWTHGARLSLHQVTCLMAEMAMQVSRGQIGCGYPECGCCADAACNDAIQQHPDFKPKEAAAQADYEARILSALTVPAQPAAGVERFNPADGSPETADQMASIMLQHGTPIQQSQALTDALLPAQPVGVPISEAQAIVVEAIKQMRAAHVACLDLTMRAEAFLRATHIADPQPPAEGERIFRRGQRVRKTKGASWQGRVVGFYSTTLTPIGYAIESEREPGSVQIYPQNALEPAPIEGEA